MPSFRRLLVALSLAASSYAQADVPPCDISEPVGPEILSQIPKNGLGKVFAFSGRRSNALTAACWEKAKDGTRHQPWASVKIYYQPVRVIPGLCRMQTASYRLQNGKWTSSVPVGMPRYAVSLEGLGCGAVDTTKATDVGGGFEDVTLLRLLEFAVRSDQSHQQPNEVGFGGDMGDRTYFELRYRSGCDTRSVLVSATAYGGFYVAGEKRAMC